MVVEIEASAELSKRDGSVRETRLVRDRGGERRMERQLGSGRSLTCQVHDGWGPGEVWVGRD